MKSLQEYINESIDITESESVWNEKYCREEAKKYRTKSEFKNGCKTAYNVALKNGWLDDYEWMANED